MALPNEKIESPEPVLKLDNLRVFAAIIEKKNLMVPHEYRFMVSRSLFKGIKND